MEKLYSKMGKVNLTNARKVLISGFYGSNNFGDEIILRTIIQILREINPRLKIFVMSHNPSKTSRIANIEEAIPHFYLNSKIFKYDLSSLKKKISKVDLVIIGGGGLLQDAHTWKMIIWHGLVLILSKLMNKPVILLGVGIGPFKSNFQEQITKHILRYPDLVMIRDKKSKEMLSGWSIKNVHLINDIVLLYKPIRTQKIKRSICISLREFNLPKTKKVEFAKFFDFLLEGGYRLFFIPTENDLGLYNEICSLMSNKEDIKILCSETDDPILVYEKLCRCEIVISMRLHMLVCAAINEIPSLGISYLPKVGLFCNSIGFRHINTQQISFSRLVKEFSILEGGLKSAQKIKIKKQKALTSREIKRIKEINYKKCTFLEKLDLYLTMITITLLLPFYFIKQLYLKKWK